MIELFQTQEAAERLQALENAAAAITNELAAMRMQGLATAVLELFKHHEDSESIHIAVTQQDNGLLAPMVGEDRWMHCSVTLRPQMSLVALPPSVLPASVVGEGEFTVTRAEVQELLELFDAQPELAVFRMRQQMEPCFMGVLHKATTNIITS